MTDCSLVHLLGSLQANEREDVAKDGTNAVAFVGSMWVHFHGWVLLSSKPSSIFLPWGKQVCTALEISKKANKNTILVLDELL